MAAFPVTSPGPLLPLDAPLPQPRNHTLLDVARIVPAADERWMSGAWINGYPSGRPQVHDPCSSGTFRLKDASAESARPMTGAFTVVIGGSCTARTIGIDSKWYTDRLGLAFQAVESTAVERTLAEGVAGDPLAAPYLGDSNMEAPTGNTPQTRREGLAVLENTLAEVGNGIIHATPAVVALWAGDYLVEQTRDNQIHTTGNGTIVVSGAGYIGVRPDGYPGDPGATAEWAFVTNFIEVRRDDLTILPGQYSQALDRVSNEITFYAERDYLLTWVGRQDSSDDEHTQAGVLIDRTN